MRHSVPCHPRKFREVKVDTLPVDANMEQAYQLVIEPKGITVNAADPGVVSTEIIRMQMFFDPITDIVFRPIIRTPRQGADTAIRLLLDEDKAGLTGGFWRSNRQLKMRKYKEHPKMQELWERTEEIVRPFL